MPQITGNLRDALGQPTLIGDLTFTPAATSDARTSGSDAYLGSIRYSLESLPSPLTIPSGAWRLSIKAQGKVNGSEQFKTLSTSLVMDQDYTWAQIVNGLVTDLPITPTLLQQAADYTEQARVYAAETVELQDTAVAGLLGSDSDARRAADSRYAATIVATGPGVDPTGATDSRDGIQAKLDAATAFAKGAEVVVPPGTYLIASSLHARSNVTLRLMQGAHLLRGYAAGPPMLCNESLTPAGKISNFRLVGEGKIGGQNLTDGGQVVFLYGDDLRISDITIDTYGGTSGSQALLIGGDRNRLNQVTITNPADLPGAGGIRMYGGTDFRATACHVVAGDDALQFTPIATAGHALRDLSISNAAYIGCTGGSTAARFMIVALQTTPPGSLTLTDSVTDAAFIGCHGYGQLRGIVVQNTDSTGQIANVAFTDCSVDMEGADSPGGQEVLIYRGPGAGRVRDIICTNLHVLNPVDSAFGTSGNATAGEYVERVTLTDCILEAPTSVDATFTPIAVDGLTVRGGRIEGPGTAHVIESGTGVNAARNVALDGVVITGIPNGLAGARLPEVVGYRVRGCTFVPSVGATTPQGLSVAAGTTGGVIESNDLSQLGGTKIAGTVAAGTIIRSNVGMVTQAKGQDTVAAAATTKSVTHGLGRTPAIRDIQLTPANAEAAASSYFVSSATANTFQITLAAAPGGAGATFNWSADASVAA